MSIVKCALPDSLKIGTLAYTQIPQVHIGPGQERHLRHELGHVVQQKQGIVRPTTWINGLPVNDSMYYENMASKEKIDFTSIHENSSQNVIQKKDPPIEEQLDDAQILSEEKSFGTCSSFEVELKKPAIFWRGDTRTPDEVFETGFSTQQELKGYTLPGKNVIRFRRGGDEDDIEPSTAVCVSDNIVGAAFFPIYAVEKIYIYAVAISRYVDTFAYQQELDKARRRKKYHKSKVSDDWKNPEDFGYMEQDSNVWQYREFAAHRILPNQIIGAFCVTREFLRSDTNPLEEESASPYGIGFKIEGDFTRNYNFQRHQRWKHRVFYINAAKDEGKYFKRRFPKAGLYVSYSGIVDQEASDIAKFPALTHKKRGRKQK